MTDRITIDTTAHGGTCPACGAPTTCTRHSGARGGSRQTDAQKSAAKKNFTRVRPRKGGHPIEYTCPCGARGREISRWRTVDGDTIKTKCRKCGKRGERKG